jgi:hypothetical protein
MRTIRTHLTYANVISSLCLVLILGGGAAYAADTVFSSDIVDGEVKGADIGTNEVRSSDVRDDTRSNGGLTSADIAPDAIGASEIDDRSIGDDDIGFDVVHNINMGDNSIGTNEIAFQQIQPNDVADGTLPSKMYTKQNSTAADTTTSKELTVSCNGTDEVSGGGYVISNGAPGANVPTVSTQRSYAVNSNTWLVRAAAENGTPTWQLTVIANCVS